MRTPLLIQNLEVRRLRFGGVEGSEVLLGERSVKVLLSLDQRQSQTYSQLSPPRPRPSDNRLGRVVQPGRIGERGLAKAAPTWMRS